jgi:hypothetical protein
MLDRALATVASRLPRVSRPLALGSQAAAPARRSTSRSWLAVEAAEIGRKSLVYVTLIGGAFLLMAGLIGTS